MVLPSSLMKKPQPLVNFRPSQAGKANEAGRKLAEQRQKPTEHLGKAVDFLQTMHDTQVGVTTTPFRVGTKP